MTIEVEPITVIRPSPIVSKIAERIPKTNLPRIVIVGGGFAGIELVRKLEKAPVQIVLLDKHNYHTFVPLLYQVATAGLSPGDISSPLREFLQDNDNFHFRLAKVKRIHPEQKEIETATQGNLSYDILILATGSKVNFFGNQEIKKSALKLREISDAIELRTRLIENFEQALVAETTEELEKRMNVVIVGAGPTGVELAGAIGELRNGVLPKDYPELDFRQMKIYLVEGQDRVLGAMSAYASRKSKRYLGKFGVTVMLSTTVSTYENGLVTLSDGTIIRSECLIWAAGVQGNAPKGLDKENVERGRIKVDAYNRVIGFEDIYAVGDVSLQMGKNYERGFPQLAPVAIQQAKHLAKNLLAKMNGKPMKEFKYTDKGTMATVGRNKAVVDAPFGIRIGGFLGWFTWMFIHLFSIIGFRRKLLVFSNWIWNYLSYSKGNRLIIQKDIDED